MAESVTKPGASRKPRRNVPWAVVAVFAVALVVRVIYLVEYSKSPTFRVPIIDSATYDEHARALLATGTFGQQFFWQGFFYPFYLAIVYLVTGGSMLAARIVQIILGSLLCAGVYGLASRIFDRRTGIAAGLIAALYGPLIFYDVEILDSGFSAIWALVLVLLILRAEGGASLWLAFVLGLCGALSTITRATFLPFFVVAFVWLIYTWRRGAMKWSAVAARGGLVVAGFLVVALPVAGLCHKATGDFNFLAESGPLNLYIGNNPDADKTIMIRPGAEWRELTRLPMVKGSMSDAQDRKVFTRLFLGYVKSEPGSYVKGLAEKKVQFLSSRELPRNDDIYVARKYSGLLSVLVWKAGRFGFPFGILLPLAIVGVVRYWRRIPVPLYLFLVFYSAAIIAVFVSGRFRISIVPILAVPAGAGVLYLLDALRSGRALAAAGTIAAIAVVAAASSLAGPFPVEKYDYEAEMHSIVGFELMKEKRVLQAVEQFNEALRIDPAWGDAHKYLGLIMSEEHRPAEAAEHLRKALAAEPDSYLLRYYLGVTLLNLGKTDEGLPYLQEARDAAVAAKEDRLVSEIDRVLKSVEARRSQAQPMPRGTR
jgi:4-amino-4-deoxy-L-arabinose transferase-like glycosyltransferase